MVDAVQPSTDIETVVNGVGARLRNLRRARALTLAELAEATGTSQATLSRLESGQRRADLELLLRLAQVFRVTLDELVDAPPTGDPRIHARPSVRYGMTWVPLTRRTAGLQGHHPWRVRPGRSVAADPPGLRMDVGWTAGCTCGSASTT